MKGTELNQGSKRELSDDERTDDDYYFLLKIYGKGNRANKYLNFSDRKDLKLLKLFSFGTQLNI